MIGFKLASSPIGRSLCGCWRGSRVSRGWERCLDDELKSSHAITLEKFTLSWHIKYVPTEISHHPGFSSIWGKAGDILSFETTGLAAKNEIQWLLFWCVIRSDRHLPFNLIQQRLLQPEPDSRTNYSGRQISLQQEETEPGSYMGTLLLMAGRWKADEKSRQYVLSIVGATRSPTSADTGNKHGNVSHPLLFTWRLAANERTASPDSRCVIHFITSHAGPGLFKGVRADPDTAFR